jgi:hypothetical protein
MMMMMEWLLNADFTAATPVCALPVLGGYGGHADQGPPHATTHSNCFFYFFPRVFLQLTTMCMARQCTANACVGGKTLQERPVSSSWRSGQSTAKFTVF